MKQMWKVKKKDSSAQKSQWHSNAYSTKYKALRVLLNIPQAILPALSPTTLLNSSQNIISWACTVFSYVLWAYAVFSSWRAAFTTSTCQTWTLFAKTILKHHLLHEGFFDFSLLWIPIIFCLTYFWFYHVFSSISSSCLDFKVFWDQAPCFPYFCNPHSSLGLSINNQCSTNICQLELNWELDYYSTWVGCGDFLRYNFTLDDIKL